MNKSMAASLQKEQAKSARVGAENKALKEKLTEARVDVNVYVQARPYAEP